MTVTTRLIVEQVDVVRNINCGQFSVFVDPLFDVLFFETTEERFGNRVVPAVSTSTHAWLKMVCTTEASPVIASVLGALIRMNNRPLGTALPNGHHHGIKD